MSDPHRSAPSPAPADLPILLVEDDADALTVYALALEYVGFPVLAAIDGEHAIRLTMEGEPSLIVLDLGLPVLDGLSVVRALRTDPGTRRIPIVVVTAHTEAEYREQCSAMGVEAFCEKPFEPRALLRIVGRLLGIPVPRLGGDADTAAPARR